MRGCLISICFWLQMSCSHHEGLYVGFSEIGEDVRSPIVVGPRFKQAVKLMPYKGKVIMVILDKKNEHESVVRGMRLYQKNHANRIKLSIWKKGLSAANMIRLITKGKVHGIITNQSRRRLANFMNTCLTYNVPILHLSSRKREDTYLLRSIYPDVSQLIQQAVLESKKRGFRSILALGSEFSRKDIEHFRHYGKQHNIQVKLGSYRHDNYDSMNHAVKTIFNVHEETRREGEAVKKAYRPARNFDAVFIAADFKTLIYFSKIFEYFNIPESLPIIGTSELRLPPAQKQSYARKHDKHYRKSFYVDFIGDYHTLPAGLNALPHNMQALKDTDMKLIGYKGVAYMDSMIEALRVSVPLLREDNKKKWQRKLAMDFTEIKKKLWRTYVIDF